MKLSYLYSQHTSAAVVVAAVVVTGRMVEGGRTTEERKNEAVQMLKVQQQKLQLDYRKTIPQKRLNYFEKHKRFGCCHTSAFCPLFPISRNT